MIDDSAGELHVIIWHVDQGFLQRFVIQKYCSETENRQQCRSITQQLHIVHSGILPAATDFTLTTSRRNHLVASTTFNKNNAFQSDTLYSLLFS